MNPSLPLEFDPQDPEHDARRATRHTDSPNRVLQLILAMVIIVPIVALPTNPAMQILAQRVLQVMMALLAGLLVLRSRFPLRRQAVAAFFRNSTNLCLLLFLLSCVVSLFVAPSLPGMRRLGVLELMRFVTGALLYFALASQVRRSDQLVRIADSLAWVGGIMAILGLASQSAADDMQRVDIFGNAQLFGGFMLILFPVTGVFALTDPDTKRKITAQVACILIFSGLIMSGLRSAWLALGATLVALMLFSLIGSTRTQIVQTIKLKYAVPILTIAACFGYVFVQSDALQMITKRIEKGAGTLETRQKYWYAARQLYKEKPVFGVGLGTYPVFQSKYSGEGRPGSAVLQTRPGLSEMAHNLWLKIAAEQGTFGFLTFAGIVVSFLIIGMRALRDILPGVRRSLLLASMGAVVGFAVDNVSNPGWEFPQIALYFWLILGVGMACIRSHYERSPHTPR